ncbi:MAG: glycosyltransferase [Patescibacteria group bacterium]
MTKLSILMSVWNGERYLRTAVESLLAQTYQEFELLIVNDASSDRTSQILHELSQQDPRVRIITNKTNLGLTRSLNRALQDIQSDYVARMDADDIALPDRLEKQVAFLESHPDVGIVGTAYQFIGADNDVIGAHRRSSRIYGGQERHPPTQDAQLRRVLIRYNPFLHSSVMIRKTLLDRVHGYDETYHRAQDYDLWMRLSPLTRLANLPDVLMQKRFTTVMISYAKEREQIRSALRVRWNAIRRRQYPWWCCVYLTKPFFATILPASVVRFVRIHIFKQHMYVPSTE